MTERLVIQQYPNHRNFIARARLRESLDKPLTSPLTTVGKDLYGRLTQVDGLVIGDGPACHVFTASLIHPALWAWDEVEPAIIQAYRDVLGGELEVIREDRQPPT